ncbi:hypothetical protein [Leptospira noguchii]|uniref:Flagellar hook protein FlgE/F/G-like D1 domain-containing protein n=1 Tax=Leptospira noguchii TaxID=28182 RepID=A0AAE9GET2_9LEPT|nr:hypothetical protein [Leptospira noguchii]UOG58789.1 hypothetical protein MAL03_20325 [Leptospira noguchii]
MKIIKFLLIYFIFTSSELISNDLSLLEEYKLLHIDLSNVRTSGYKSYFNDKRNKAEYKINLNQGTLRIVKSSSNLKCGIIEFGFFKIKLSNGLIGYTRQCNLKINKNSEIINKQYSFYNPIYIPKNLNLNTFKILLNGEISFETLEKEELVVGKFVTYKISPELLDYYGDGIYIVKRNKEITEEAMHNEIHSNVIELSNFGVLQVLLRMYCILLKLNEKQIPNIEFKKELIKTEFISIANDKNFLKAEILSYYSDEKIEKIFDNNENQRLFFLESILPYIKYDY